MKTNVTNYVLKRINDTDSTTVCKKKRRISKYLMTIIPNFIQEIFTNVTFGKEDNKGDVS